MSGIHGKVSDSPAPGFAVSEYHYDLPESLIAQHPTAKRGSSRLLCVDGGHDDLHDRQFSDLPSLLRENDLLVLNDTRVVPARMYGAKDSGGRVEVMLERLHTDGSATVQIRASKSPRPGTRIDLERAQVTVQVSQREGEFYRLVFPHASPAAEVFEAHGETPLPPYIKRSADEDDRERYQTVYAKIPGAVAAPTAGLHFDQPLLDRVQQMGVDIGFITLHVGAGTFQPLRVEDLRAHQMHAETIDVSPGLCDAIDETRRRGGRVVAVGTTVVRALETAANTGVLAPYHGETRLFIYPGYRFRVVDVLLTNFHLPGSSLLMLVCAFAGHSRILRAYQHAVNQRYRFFSYGDAMWLTPGPDNTA